MLANERTKRTFLLSIRRHLLMGVLCKATLAERSQLTSQISPQAQFASVDMIHRTNLHPIQVGITKRAV